MSATTMAEAPISALEALGIKPAKQVFYQHSPQQLIDAALALGMGELNDTGALVIHTGKFTGRSPKDRFL